MRICEVGGCSSKHLAKGMCRAHYLLNHKHGRTHKVAMRGEPVVARIMAKVSVDKNGCWIFTGHLFGRNGYGGIAHDGTTRGVHIVMYEDRNGRVPEGLELDHLCRVPRCCNPDHLEAVTHAENVRRGNGPDTARARIIERNRLLGQRPACKAGHAYTEENTGRDRNGHRVCRACARIKTNAYAVRRRSAGMAAR